VYLNFVKGVFKFETVFMDKIIDNKNQGLKLMSELRNQTETTLDAIAEIDKMVNETSDNTNKIVLAVETIKQIATQTNLLALNAAIVASRGEPGEPGGLSLRSRRRHVRP